MVSGEYSDVKVTGRQFIIAALNRRLLFISYYLPSLFASPKAVQPPGGCPPLAGVGGGKLLHQHVPGWYCCTVSLIKRLLSNNNKVPISVNGCSLSSINCHLTSAKHIQVSPLGGQGVLLYPKNGIVPRYSIREKGRGNTRQPTGNAPVSMVTVGREGTDVLYGKPMPG